MHHGKIMVKMRAVAAAGLSTHYMLYTFCLAET